MIIRLLYRILNLSLLFLYFSFKVLEAGWIVGWLVIKGYRGQNGGMVDYRVQSNNPWHIILLFNLMSMTPGSLSVDLSDDHLVISVHLLNYSDKESFVETSQRIEKMLLRIFRNTVTKNENIE